MRIATHTSHYPYATRRAQYVSGGGERVAKAVAEALSERGHSVEVFAASADDRTVGTVNGVKVRRCRSIATIGTTRVAPAQFRPRRTDADVIHIHNTTPPGVISGIAHSLATGTPVVLTHHGNDRYVPDGSPLKRACDFAYAELLLDPILQRCDAITVPSSAYLSASPRLRNWAGKTVEVPNGIDRGEFRHPEAERTVESEFGVSPASFLVLFVGDLIPKKGPDRLVEAARRLDGDAEVVIAGDGDLLNDLRRSAPPNVHLPGYVSPEEKRALYDRADAFCLPSQVHTEVFPLVVLEAYASKTPVVATDLATFDRIVLPGETGFLVERESVAVLADRLRWLSHNESRRRQMAERSFEFAGNFEWSRIAARYERVFDRVVRHRSD